MGNVLDYSDCPYPKWIITDVRFPNEAEAIKKRDGILIRIDRNYVSTERLNRIQQRHSSETALDDYDGFDNTIFNNGTLEDLYNIAKQIVTIYKLT